MARDGGVLKVKINGTVTEIEEPLSVAGLMTTRGINPSEVVVQYNGDIVDKSGWETILLKENDELEILRFVGGG